MAGGPIFPHSAFPFDTAGRLFPNFHVGAGANSKHDGGRFVMPPTLPTGTGKFVLKAIANATAGIAKINPKWVSVANGEDPSSATPVAETTTADAVAGLAGATVTLEWGAGDADQYGEAKWTMNADTLVGGEVVVMDLVFETTGWTLAQILTVFPYIIFE